jgi:23S rRNA (cytosine1962-C5)-methyltransferase
MSGAVARVDGDALAGELVRVVAANGETLGHGHYAPSSQLRVRLLAFEDEPCDESLVTERLRAAVAARARHPLLADTNARRLVNAEGDGLPGLVVDQFADVVVVRAGSAAWLARSTAVADALRDLTGARVGLARPDAAALRREGAPAEPRTLWGEPPSEPVLLREGARSYLADVAHGQKTGFYLDQRDARDLVQRLAAGKRVLDLFSYTGGFAVAALHGGAAEVVLVDSSRDALALAERNVGAARAGDGHARFIETDGFEFARKEARGFELAIADPPPLARRKADVTRAARAHKDVLLHLLRAAAPGASVLAFSCSHHIGPELFRKIAFGAALDAGRDARVSAELAAPADHPVSLFHPEGRYLTGLLLEVRG